jgi:hypothetical protein
MEALDRISYSIDKEDRLIRISRSWTDFAVENDAPELAAENVEGRALWVFISDETTEHLYRQIVENVRSGISSSFGLRCDSPGWRRSLVLTINPAPDGEVTFDAEVLKVEPREEQILFDRKAERSDEFVKTCGWCNRIEAPTGSWAQVEDAVFLLDLFWTHLPPKLLHGICSECLKRMSDHISRMILPHSMPPSFTSH